MSSICVVFIRSNNDQDARSTVSILWFEYKTADLAAAIVAALITTHSVIHVAALSHFSLIDILLRQANTETI